MQFSQVILLTVLVVPTIAIKCYVGDQTFYDGREHSVSTRKQDCGNIGNFCEKESISFQNSVKVSYACPTMNNMQIGVSNKCTREGCFPNNLSGSAAYTCCCSGNYCNSATSSKLATVMLFAISWMFYKYQ